MSPEEWLASKSQAAPADAAPTTMSPEQWLASKAQATPAPAAPVAQAPAPAEDLTKAAFTRPHGIRTQGPQDIARQKQLAEEFGRDPSKAGQLSLSDYLTRAAKGAGIGGATMGTIGAFTGPGIVPMAATGAVGGAISGLAGAAAEDLGFGTGTQTLAELAAPQPGGAVAKAAGAMIPKTVTETVSKAVKPVGEMMQELVAHKLFGWGAYPIKRGMAALEKTKPVDVAAFEKATGVPAASKILPGTTENVDATRKAIAGQYGIIGDKPESQVYEAAKTAYDAALTKENFLKSPEFQALTLGNPSLNTKFSKVFKNERGQMETGQDVMQKIKDFASANAKTDPAAVKRLQATFNGYLQRTTGKPWEQEARSAAEAVFVANAKDQLPTLLTNTAKDISGASKSRALLRDQIQNLSKTPQSQQVFFEETANALKTLNVADAKNLWATIGPNVNRYMIKDPTKYQELTKIMSGIKTPADIANASRVLSRIMVSITEPTRDQ